MVEAPLGIFVTGGHFPSANETSISGSKDLENDYKPVKPPKEAAEVPAEALWGRKGIEDEASIVLGKPQNIHGCRLMFG